jgi:hypothetical protein
MVTQKVKTLRTALILLFVGYVVFSIGGKFYQVIGGVGLLFGCVTLLQAGYQFISSSSNEVTAYKMTENLPYRHFFQDSGIALDPEKKEIHLYLKPNYKKYKFEDIRQFETNIQTGGTVFGTGLAVAANNLASAQNNAKNSGLYIDVRDIEFPRWKISFNARKNEKELPRWMEILRQHVNES